MILNGSFQQQPQQQNTFESALKNVLNALLTKYRNTNQIDNNFINFVDRNLPDDMPTLKNNYIDKQNRKSLGVSDMDIVQLVATDYFNQAYNAYGGQTVNIGMQQQVQNTSWNNSFNNNSVSMVSPTNTVSPQNPTQEVPQKQVEEEPEFQTVLTPEEAEELNTYTTSSLSAFREDQDLMLASLKSSKMNITMNIVEKAAYRDKLFICGRVFVNEPIFDIKDMINLLKEDYYNQMKNFLVTIYYTEYFIIDAKYDKTKTALKKLKALMIEENIKDIVSNLNDNPYGLVASLGEILINNINRYLVRYLRADLESPTVAIDGSEVRDIPNIARDITSDPDWREYFDISHSEFTRLTENITKEAMREYLDKDLQILDPNDEKDRHLIAHHPDIDLREHGFTEKTHFNSLTDEDKERYLECISSKTIVAKPSKLYLSNIESKGLLYSIENGLRVKAEEDKSEHLVKLNEFDPLMSMVYSMFAKMFEPSDVRYKPIDIYMINKSLSVMKIPFGRTYDGEIFTPV